MAETDCTTQRPTPEQLASIQQMGAVWKAITDRLKANGQGLDTLTPYGWMLEGYHYRDAEIERLRLAVQSALGVLDAIVERNPVSSSAAVTVSIATVCRAVGDGLRKALDERSTP
jgi:hypothetical protein